MRVRRPERGFTLAEMAVALGVSVIVAGLMCVGGLHAKKASECSSAKSGVATLETAIRAFQAKRGALPKDIDGNGVTTCDEVVSQLKGWGVLRQDFQAFDPWGSPYVIVLKRDYGVSADAMLDHNLYPLNDSPEGFQAYSKGPDGKSSAVSADHEALDNIANFQM